MKNQFLMIVMLFTFGIANGQNLKFSISQTEISDFNNLENTNNKILNKIFQSETLTVSFQHNSAKSIKAKFTREKNESGIKVIGEGQQFYSEFNLYNGRIIDGHFSMNGTSYGIEVNHTDKGDILYYFRQPEVSQNLNTINVDSGYSNLTSFSDLSQSEDFLKLWGSEAQDAIKFKSNIDLDPNAPIFWGAYDWHSSVEGHWMSVYASFHFNDASYRQEAYSRYTDSNINGEKFYNPDINEELYGFQWLFMYADYLFHNDQATFNKLKPMFDARYQEYLTGAYYPSRFGPNSGDREYYYKRNLGSGYFNSNFGLNGAYLYAKIINDTATAEHIKSFVTQYSSSLDWNNIFTDDFMDPATAALMIYTNIGNTSGTGWENLISYWKSRSLSIPSLSRLSAHQVGIYAFKTIGLWKMYEITNDEKFKTAYINHVDTIFKELKRFKSDPAYHYQLGHWIPNIMALALKENIDANTVIIDTEKPTTPTNLTASSITTSSVQFNWSAASDNIGVKNYELYLNNVLTATTTMTNVTINNLAENTNYTFAVIAVDNSDNKSDLSSVNFTTLESPDTEAPSTPTGLAVSNIDQSSGIISWNNATDNKGIASYEIYLNNELIGNTSSTSYTLSNLTPNTSYNVGVKSVDLSNNSSVITQTQFTTLEEIVEDAVKPEPVPFIISYNVNYNDLTLLWGQATDNKGISHYDIYQNGQKIGTTSNETFEVTNLSSGVEYDFWVIAFDTSGNSSSITTYKVKTKYIDNENPTEVATIIPYQITENLAIILWSKSTDNISLQGYNVMVNGEKLYSTENTFAVIPDLSPSTDYTLGVVAYDEVGNMSNETSISATTLSGDTIPPTDIEFIATAQVTNNSATIVWSNSTDNIEVHEYEVYVNGVKKTTTIDTNVTLSALSSGTSYTIGVKAKDKAGNTSNIKNITIQTL